MTKIWFGTALVLAIHAAAATAGGTWWGLHFARYLHPAHLSIAIAGGILTGTWIAHPPTRGRWMPAALESFAFGVAAFIVFWVLRDRLHYLGDGSVFAEFRPQWSAWANREPLAHVIAHQCNGIAAAWQLPVERVFEVWSCILGAATVAALAHADREMEARGLLLGFALTTGATQLFCGYVEHYPPVALAVVLFLLELRCVVSARRSLVPLFALFAVALLLHVQSVLLLPALAWGVLHQLRQRTAAARWGAALELAGVALLTFTAWGILFRGVEGAPSFTGYLAILAKSNRFALGSTYDASSVAPPLLSARHLLDFVNLQLLLVPVVLPIVIAGALRIGVPKLMSRPWDAALAMTAAAYLGAQFVFDPYLGAPRDWDALATGALPMGILAARVAPSVLAGLRAPAIAVGLAAAHTLAFVLVNAIPASATARFEELPLSAGQVDFVMGTRALKAGALDDAARRFEEVVRVAPYSTPGWFSLGMARERQRDFESARAAFARALAARQFDQRVPAAEILERIGRAALETGRLEEARRALELALRERPQSPAGRTLMEAVEARERQGD